MTTREQRIAAIQKDWDENPRWKGISRGYTAADVVRLRGCVPVEHTLARRGAEKLWALLHNEPFVNALGALTGNQAVQQVQAGLKAIYLSRLAGRGRRQPRAARCIRTRASIRPTRCRRWCERINNALQRADQIASRRRRRTTSTGSRRSWPMPKPASAAR